MWVAVEKWLSSLELHAGHANNIASTGELVGVIMLISVLATHEEGVSSCSLSALYLACPQCRDEPCVLL